MSAQEAQCWRDQGQCTTEMLIRIFGKKDQEPYGDIVHNHLKKPVPYQGAAELVLKIDAISRSLHPESGGNRFRSVYSQGAGNRNTLPEEYWQEEAPGVPVRVKDTLYLQLVGRQHTSIQGRICGRLTRRKYISFRSALGLIYLLWEEQPQKRQDSS